MKKNDKTIIFVIIISFILMIIAGILIDDEMVFKIDLIKMLFLIGILGSSSYSGIIMLDGMYYQLCFGMTRKKIFKKYLLDLLFVLLIILGYSLVYLITKSIISLSFKPFNELLNSLVYIGIYLFCNALSFILGSLTRNKYIIFILAIVIDLLLLLNVHLYIKYFIYLFPLVGIVLYLFGYKIIKNMKIKLIN